MPTLKKNTLDVLEQLNLAGQVKGDGEHFVICLHGWLDNSNSFKPMFDVLPECGNYTWLAIDLPGHGLSGWKSNDAHYYFIDYVYDLLKLLDALKLDSCYLVGHSMGAMISNLFAACYPERVKGMALIDGIGIVTTCESDTKKQLVNAFRQRNKVMNVRSSNKRFESFDQLVKARVQVSDLEYENAAILMKRNSKTQGAGVEILTDPRLKQHSGFRFSLAQAQACIKDINTSTLLLEAQRGLLMGESNSELFKKAFRNLTEVQLRGGHHCHMEYPKEAYSEIIGHFMQVKAS